MNTYRKQVHQLISNYNQNKTKEQQLWDKFKAQSAAYAKALDLSDNDLISLVNLLPHLPIYPDLKDISNTARIISVNIDNNDYVISCKKVCGAKYGDEWGNYLFGICLSDSSINITMRYGITVVNILPDNIHSKLCEELRK